MTVLLSSFSGLADQAGQVENDVDESAGALLDGMTGEDEVHALSREGDRHRLPVHGRELAHEAHEILRLRIGSELAAPLNTAPLGTQPPTRKLQQKLLHPLRFELRPLRKVL